MFNLKEDLTSDAPIFVIEDAPEASIEQSPTPSPVWTVLIVDDDPEVHEATTLACGAFKFEERSLELLSAYSSAEAKKILQSKPDIALLLVDVVMETSHAGLELVRYVREDLDNQLTRIVLRTGQPGEAPELDVIMDFDINDYRLKVDLTRQRLLTTVITSLRSYRDLVALTSSYRNLDALYYQQKMATQQIEDQQQELRVQNQALTVAKQHAEEASQAKSIFLRNMSHELRTPLNAVLGYTQLLAREPQLQTFTKELGTINRCGEHLLALINDVLELTRIDSGQMRLSIKTFDLHELLRTLQDIWTPQAQMKGLSYRLVWGLDLPHYAQSDDGKLRQVLMNLLSNAIKFTTAGHVICHIYQTEVKPDDRIKVGQVSSLNPNYWLHFEIQDSGPGISIDELQHIFHPFIQGKHARNVVDEGTGLGLTISHQFVSLMGGELTVDSTVGKGSCFQFSIPVKTDRMDSPNLSMGELKVQSLAPGQPTYRILVVDDQVDNCQFLCQLLSMVGFEVKAAYSGESAVTQCREWSPHLIWMDIRMEGQDGYETTQMIKSDSATLSPIIVALTAFAFEEDREKALGMGFDDFVRKPCQETEIFETLSTHLGVKYRYEGEMQVPPTESLVPLKSEQLVFFSQDQLQQLYEAALNLDPYRTSYLLTHIPSEHSAIHHQLLWLTDNFRFDIIIELLEPLLNEMDLKC